MTGTVLLAVVVLSVAGALPTLALVGTRPVALVLLPLTGSALAGVSATCCVLIAGDLGDWFVICSVTAAAVVVGVWIRRPTTRPALPDLSTRARTVPVVVGGLLVAVVVVWALWGLRVMDVGQDARVIWITRGGWYVRGHGVARSVLSNRAYLFDEPAFPPLVGATSGIGWIVGRIPLGSAAAFRSGQILMGILNGCGLFALGASLLQVGRRNPGGGGDTVRSDRTTTWAAAVAAPVLCAAVAGAAGRGLTNGLADLPWMLAAAFAVVYGLILPLTRSHLGIAVIGMAVAGQIKLEGTATAAVVVVLVALRYALAPRSPSGGGRGATPQAGGSPARRERGTRALVGAVVGLVALAAWPATTVVLGAIADPNRSGHRQGSLGLRLHATWDTLGGYLHIVPLAALVAVVAALTLSAARRRLGLGGDLGLWVVLVANLMVVGGTYVIGSTAVRPWLGVSADRVVVFAVILSLTDLAVWLLVAVEALSRSVPVGPTDREEPPDRPVESDPRSPALVDAP